MASIPSTNNTKRWASLADRLNPNRPSFDAQLKASWKTMSKKQRKQIIKEDKIAIAALKSRGTSQSLPFTAEEDDHCETSPVAYTHIAPILQLIASRLNKKPCDLLIYDPYYCAGGMLHNMDKLGYNNVYNKCEDFYDIISKKQVPKHDVIITNPPYSGDHFHKLLSFLQDNNKPALLLLPEHFSKNKSSLYKSDNFCFLTPPERYHYWTPEGMRLMQKESSKKRKQHKNLVLGSRNSPFASHWFISLEPIMSNGALVSLVNDGKDDVKLVDGCRLYRKEEEIIPTTFKGTAVVQSNKTKKDIDNTDKRKKKKRRRRKRSKEEGS